MIYKYTIILCYTVGLILISGSAYPQSTLKLKVENEMQYEKQGDPYLPNEFNNQKTAPANKYSTPDSILLNGTTITTVQVNVNGSGQNIVGDAGNETTITLDPAFPNNIIIGWRQFDNVSSNFRQAGYAYSTNAGASWTFPGSINPGVFRSDPILDYDLNGNIFYNSLTNTPDFLCKVFKSTSSGATWDAGTDAHGGDKQWMAVDHTTGTGAGNIYSSWTGSVNASSCDPGFFTRSANGNISYEPCTIVNGYPWWGTMTVGSGGELYIGAGHGFYTDSLLFARSLNAKIPNSLITWDTVSVYMDGKITYYVPINPAGMVGQVNIDVDRSTGPGQGNIYMLASLIRISNSDPADVMFVKSTDGGSTWSTPIRINDDVSTTNIQWLAVMSVAPNGRIDAVWLDTRDTPNSDISALYYSYSTDEGNSWSANEKLSGTFDPHVGYPNQSKMGDYMDMQSDSTGAHLAWCATFNGEEDVYYSHIVPNITTGLDQISYTTSMSVYPNPFSSEVVFRTDNLLKNANLTFYSYLGQLVAQLTNINGRTVTFHRDNLPSGMYFIRLTQGNHVIATKKLIITD